MSEKHEQFENFLREFQLRRPRALPAPQTDSAVWKRRLAAAAIVAIATGSSLWFISRPFDPHREESVVKLPTSRAKNTAAQPLALLPLTRLALEDPSRLDAALTEASRNVLTDLRRDDSTLRALAKD